jgi:hypothetical protein
LAVPGRVATGVRNDRRSNYYLALDEGGGEDAPVYLFYHDGGDHRRIADSLQQFLSWRTTPISFDN